MNSRNEIEEMAALWVVRLERGLTAEEQDAFLEWLGRDARHGPALTEQRAGWTRLNLLADWRPMHGTRPNRDLLAPAPSPRVGRRRTAVRLALAASVAALLVVGTFQLRSPVATDAPSPPSAAPIAAIEQRFLADGTVITLNRGAEVSVHYRADERQVLLAHGEAHFEVARDPNRPFVVEAGGVRTRAVGTAFSVQLRSAAVQVLVAEGKVDVQSRPAAESFAAASRVEAGQRCVVLLGEPLRPAVIDLSPPELARALAWKPRMLDFSDRPLAAILDEFNLHNTPYHLEIDPRDATLPALTLNASVRSDNVEGFLRLLERGFGIRAERTGSRVTLSYARTP